MHIIPEGSRLPPTRIAFEESTILNFSCTFLCSKVEFQSVPKGMTRPIANEGNGVYKVTLKNSDEHELTLLV